MTRRILPIGIQTFRKIREGGCYYVDKTAYVQRLLDEGTHYFLSRPRRFGKSLFLDTCKELFEGNEALFEGLAVHDRWDWSVRHPVVRLSFGAKHFKQSDDLRAAVMDRLVMQESQAGITTRHESAPARLAHVIRTLHERTGQRVAVLVDEYDKPILDALDVPEVARANRDYLRGLYAVIKDCDADIRFSFITGVSKFSKVSLFSGLNNLTDITLDPGYSSICGYTDADLDAVFAPELPGLDRDAIREWYNGCGWRGDERVYNPFDILLLFRNREFGAWWFETGTPAFLVEPLFRRRVSALSLHRMLGSAELLSTFDVDDIASYEGFCASVFYSYFAGLGLDITVEDSTSHGRLDVAVRFNANVYLFELKVVEVAGEGAAMAQLKERRYADKYRGAGEPIHLVAVEFSRETRNVVAFEAEPG